jgi:hypothetical protein
MANRVLVPSTKVGSGYAQGWLDPEEAFRRAVGAEPLDWQRPYLWETRNSVVLKGRQVGASTGASVVAVRAARLGPNRLVAIVSPSQKQSAEVRERCRQGLERMKIPLVMDNATTLGLGNGSRIISLPGTPKSVRGWSAHFLIIDEAAFLDPQTFLAARATVAATGGRVIVQSTPESPYGHFYELYNEATPVADSFEADGSPKKLEWVSFAVSSEDVTTIDPDFLASERATLGEDEYAQEYLGRFGRPGLGLVDPEKLKKLTRGVEPVRAPTVWDTMREARS